MYVSIPILLKYSIVSPTPNLEKIESDIDHADYGNGLVHDVILSKDSNLYKILGKDIIKVNSRHRMKVTDPGTFDVFGKSEDGVIEVLERHDKKFALGVQWHPEMMLDDSLQKLIFDAFVNACKEWFYGN